MSLFLFLVVLQCAACLFVCFVCFFLLVCLLLWLCCFLFRRSSFSFFLLWVLYHVVWECFSLHDPLPWPLCWGPFSACCCCRSELLCVSPVAHSAVVLLLLHLAKHKSDRHSSHTAHRDLLCLHRNLYNNQLTGRIPDSLGNLSSLQNMCLPFLLCFCSVVFCCACFMCFLFPLSLIVSFSLSLSLSFFFAIFILFVPHIAWFMTTPNSEVCSP